MKVSIPKTDHASMTTEAIIAEFDMFEILASEVVIRYSLGLKELRRRGQPHKFFGHPVLRFWRGLTEGALSPVAAIHLGNSELIKAVLPLPRDEQEEVAKGRPVPVATVTSTGDIRSDDLPITRMDPATLKRAFGPEGIRTVHEQAEMIRADGRRVKADRFTVFPDRGTLRCRGEFTVEENAKALARLGYQVKFVGGGVVHGEEPQHEASPLRRGASHTFREPKERYGKAGQ